jgi:hypothetical protein
VLRSGTDKQDAQVVQPMQLGSLMGGKSLTLNNSSAGPAAASAPRMRPAAVHVAAPPATFTVETVSGEKSTTDTFRMGAR